VLVSGNGDFLSVDVNTGGLVNGASDNADLVLGHHNTDFINVGAWVSEARSEVIALGLIKINEARVDLEGRSGDQIEVLIWSSVDLEVLSLQARDTRIALDDNNTISGVDDVAREDEAILLDASSAGLGKNTADTAVLIAGLDIVVVRQAPTAG